MKKSTSRTQYQKQYRAEHPRDPEYMKQWRIEHRDEQREYMKQYLAEHRDKELERMKQWRNDNPELWKQYLAEHRDERREYMKQWRAEHCDERRGYVEQWHIEHPGMRAVYNHRRRSLINSNGGSFTADELNALFEQQEGFCFYCGKLLFGSFETAFHVEHKVPLSRGGSNNIDNIALSCAKCNLSKHTKTHDEFLNELKKIGEN